MNETETDPRTMVTEYLEDMGARAHYPDDESFDRLVQTSMTASNLAPSFGLREIASMVYQMSVRRDGIA